jgi:hypothetical protein
MEFFDKKQDVIDLQLTGYGKQLLSRGLFKPVYYAFSDDEVVYDARWVSGSNGDSQQSDIETRIQEETPRLKTQYRKVGAEKAIFNALNASSLYGAFSSILEVAETTEIKELELINTLASLNVDFAEAEKLLNNILGNKSFQNSYDPAWNALFYHGEISGSTPYYKKNDIFLPKIPQLNCTLKDRAYRTRGNLNPFDFSIESGEAIAKVAEVEKGLSQRANVLETGGETQPPGSSGVFFERFVGDVPKKEAVAGLALAAVLGLITEEQFNEALDKLTPALFIEKDFLFISLEEANVDFDRDNFMIEVYEVETIDNSDDGEERLTKMFFQNESQIGLTGEQGSVGDLILNRSVEEVFYFEVDQEINSQLACYLIGKDKSLKKQSLYVDNVFNCEDIFGDAGISIDPYTSLPEVDTGDVC